MDIKIRKFEELDKDTILKMMRKFYDSDAVFVKSPDTVLIKDFDDCMDESNPFLYGYAIIDESNIIGYFMISMCYSTEYATKVIYIEDVYLTEEYRGKGIAKIVFEFLKTNFKDVKRWKLEVEKENRFAIKAYEKAGFHLSPYFEMTKEL